MPMTQQRVIMRGIHIGQKSRLPIKCSRPNSHEHIRIVVCAQVLISCGNGLCRLYASRKPTLDLGLCRHHKESCWYAFATYVCDQKSHGTVIHRKEVVEVATNLPDGIHRGIEVNAILIGKSREYTGQSAFLNGTCRGKVALHIR